MPANKITQQESEFFPDIAHGSQSALMEFLFIRNKLLQTWVSEPTTELTAEKAQNIVILPQSGIPHYIISNKSDWLKGFGSLRIIYLQLNIYLVL